MARVPAGLPLLALTSRTLAPAACRLQPPSSRRPLLPSPLLLPRHHQDQHRRPHLSQLLHHLLLRAGRCAAACRCTSHTLTPPPCGHASDDESTEPHRAPPPAPLPQAHSLRRPARAPPQPCMPPQRRSWRGRAGRTYRTAAWSGRRGGGGTAPRRRRCGTRQRSWCGRRWSGQASPEHVIALLQKEKLAMAASHVT